MESRPQRGYSYLRVTSELSPDLGKRCMRNLILLLVLLPQICSSNLTLAAMSLLNFQEGGMVPATAIVPQVTPVESHAMALLKTNPTEAAIAAKEYLDSNPQLPTFKRMEFLWIRGAGLSISEQHAEAVRVLQEAADLARQNELAGPKKSKQLLRMTMRYLAASAYEIADYKLAKSSAEEGLAVAKELNDSSRFTMALHNELGNIESALGNLDEAIRQYRHSESLAQFANENGARLLALSNLASALDRAKQSDDAIRMAEEVIKHAEVSKHRLLLAATRVNLAGMLTNLGRLDEAEGHLESARMIMPEKGGAKIMAQAEAASGRIAIKQGRFSEGQRLLESAMVRFEVLNDAVSLVGLKQELSNLSDDSNKLDARIAELQNTIKQTENLSSPDLLQALRHNLVDCYRKAGRWKEVAELQLLIADTDHKLWDRALQEQLALQVADQRFAIKEAEVKSFKKAAEVDRLERQNFRLWIFGLAITAAILFVLVIGISSHLIIKRGAMAKLNKANEEIREQRRIQLEMERQLGRQQKVESLGLMASGIAHDFNNLLSGITGLADIGQLSDSPKAKDEYFRQISSTSMRASGLTGQLLQFLGKPVAEQGSCDLIAATKSVAGLLTSMARPRQLCISIGVESLRAAISESQIHQILVNLVTNATEATNSDGSIHVSLDQKSFITQVLDSVGVEPAGTIGDFCVLTVKDDGKGLSADTRDRLFDPYFSTKALGRGLGLSSVLGIVRSCRGFVRVESQLGEGCTFIVHIPTSKVEPAISTPERLSKNESRSAVAVPAPHFPIDKPQAAVLLVDDEPLLVRCISEYLTAKGYRVFPANNAQEALEILERNLSVIQCVVTDYSMPTHSGYWLAANARKLNAKLPIILCTGFSDDNLPDEHAISARLAKPFQPKQLQQIIEELLANGEVGALVATNVSKAI